MRLGWAIAAGVVGGAALAWWLAPESVRWPWAAGAGQRAGAASTAEGYNEVDAPALYRWRDDAGNLQLTQVPPQGRPYERVSIPRERNVIPMAVEPRE